MKLAGHPVHAVVGYDGTERNADVARAALDMRRRFGTTLEFVHAIDLPRVEEVSGRPDIVGEMEADIEASAFEFVSGKLSELASDADERRALATSLRVVVGKPAKVVVDRAEEVQADLVMIGPHERHGRFDFGSTARAILSKAPCDVWIQPGPVREVRKVLVPVDLSEESMRALAVARDLAQEYGGAHVLALHVFQLPDVAYAASPGYPIAGPTYVVDDVRRIAENEFREAMAAFDWKGLAHEARFEEGRPADVILELSGDVDLVAMGSHGRTGLAAAVLGNVAYTVLREAKVPVLALRHSTRGWLLG